MLTALALEAGRIEAERRVLKRRAVTIKRCVPTLRAGVRTRIGHATKTLGFQATSAVGVRGGEDRPDSTA